MVNHHYYMALAVSFCEPISFLSLLLQVGFPRKSFFTFDEIEIPTKFYPNLVEISMFRISKISISMSKSEFRFWFRFRLFTFDEIEIPTKVHIDFVEISMSKSEFRFRFRHRNSDSDFDFESEFRFRHRNSEFGT
jgi:hypothetical protein